MGSLRKPRLSESEVCRLYRAGQSRNAIGLAAQLYDHEVVAVLVRNGVPLRGDAEARAISIKNRERFKSTQAARLKRRRA